MKLVYKTLHKKQAFLHAMLILLLFLSLLSLQITFTVFTKGQNMAERIDKMDVATTNIFYKEYDDEIKDFLQEYKEDGNLDFTYEESLVWPYGVFSTSWMQETSPIYLEGFVKSDAHYPLLEGKPLKDLKGHEIGVMESYARSLRKQGIEPLGHEIEITGSFQEKEKFTITSVFDYPNYDDGYANQKNSKAIQDYQITRRAVGIVNEKTIEQINGHYVKTYGLEKAAGLYERILKLKIKDYSAQKEYALRSDAYNDDRTSSAQIDFRLLADEIDGNHVQDGIFQFVSLSVTFCLVVSCLFVLFAFMKRKLIEDREKLHILIANGIMKKNIQKAYGMEYGQLFAAALGLLIVFDIVLQLVLAHQQNYVLRLLFSLSTKTVLYLLPVTILFFIGLLALMLWQVHACFQANLSHAMKAKDVHITKRTHRIRYRWQSLHMAWREVLTHPFSSMRNILSLAIIFLTILLLFMTQSILWHLYTPATFGLQFDYQLYKGIAYDDFMELKKEYFDVFAFMDETKRFTSIDKEFMVYDKSTRDSVEFHYYPGMHITLTGSLKHFLPVKEGVYPPPVGAEGGETLMEKMRTMVPRRIQHDFHRYIMYSDYVKKHPEVANDTYAEFSQGWRVNGYPIYGFTESIVNQGYVAFASRNMSPLDREHYPQMPKTILKLKGSSQKQVFEAALKEKGIAYDSYDTVLHILQENNNDLSLKLRYVMISVAMMGSFVLLLTLYANVRADEAMQKMSNICYAHIGMQKKIRLQRDILYQGMIIVAAMILAILLYGILQYPYFQVLGVYLGLYELPSGAIWILPVCLVIVVLLYLLLIVITRKRKHPNI